MPRGEEEYKRAMDEKKGAKRKLRKFNYGKQKYSDLCSLFVTLLFPRL